MEVLYFCDNEESAIMELSELCANFEHSGAFREIGRYRSGQVRYNLKAEWIEEELAHRGWFEDCHDNGHFLIVRLDKLDALEGEILKRYPTP